MNEQPRVEIGVTAPTVETVREGLRNLEPFIPQPLMALHKMPETRQGEKREYKFIMPYARKITGKNSFYVISGSGDSIPGVKVDLLEASHRTELDYNTHNPQNRVEVNVDFTGKDKEALENAGKILAIPDAPSGYKIREGKSGRIMLSDYREGVENVNDAIRANLDKESGKRSASKLVTELGNNGERIQVYVDINIIGGGAYTEIVYYDKIKT